MTYALLRMVLWRGVIDLDPYLTPEIIQLYESQLILTNKMFESTPCVEWGGRLDRGWGVFDVPGMKPVRAHRFAWRYQVGPIPDETPEVDHRCRNRPCQAILHLEPVTTEENQRRGDWGLLPRLHAEQTHCRSGHRLAGWNLYSRPRNIGGRDCLICRTVAHVRWVAASKGRSVPDYLTVWKPRAGSNAVRTTVMLALQAQSKGNAAPLQALTEQLDRDHPAHS
jgi:hypothetical protein